MIEPEIAQGLIFDKSGLTNEAYSNREKDYMNIDKSDLWSYMKNIELAEGIDRPFYYNGPSDPSYRTHSIVNLPNNGGTTSLVHHVEHFTGPITMHHMYKLPSLWNNKGVK